MARNGHRVARELPPFPRKIRRIFFNSSFMEHFFFNGQLEPPRTRSNPHSLRAGWFVAWVICFFSRVISFTRRRIRNRIDPLIFRTAWPKSARTRLPHKPTRIHEPHSGSIIEISIPVIDEPDRSRDVSQVTGGITNVCAETSSMYLSFVSVHAISKW